MTWQIAGKVVLVTGGNAGIGKATATALAAAGARVTIACRDAGRARQAQRDIERKTAIRVDVLALDLADLRSARAAAEAIGVRHRALHVLVNNAGVFSVDRRRETVDGFERHFGVNHLGHFALTSGLLDLLGAEPPARIVNVASSGFELCPKGLPWDDLQWTSRYNGWVAYGASKLCNLYFTWELARRYAGAGITANVLHPGAVLTDLGRLRPEERDPGVTPPAPKPPVDLSSLTMLTPEQGARGSVWLSAAPELAGVTGAYFDDVQRQVALTGIAADLDEAARLWRVSEGLLTELSS